MDASQTFPKKRRIQNWRWEEDDSVEKIVEHPFSGQPGVKRSIELQEAHHHHHQNMNPRILKRLRTPWRTQELAVVLHCDILGRPYRIEDFRKPLQDAGVIKDVAVIGAYQMSHVWLVNLRSDEAKKKLVEAGRLVVKERLCIVIDPNRQEVRLKLHWMALDVINDNIRRAFSEYGEVKEVANDRWRVEGFEGADSLTKFVKLFLKGVSLDDIPHQIRLGSGTALIVAPGRAPLCLRCKHTGHIRRDCRVPRCTECHAFGHSQEACALGATPERWDGLQLQTKANSSWMRKRPNRRRPPRHPLITKTLKLIRRTVASLGINRQRGSTRVTTYAKSRGQRTRTALTRSTRERNPPESNETRTRYWVRNMVKELLGPTAARKQSRQTQQGTAEEVAREPIDAQQAILEEISKLVSTACPRSYSDPRLWEIGKQLLEGRNIDLEIDPLPLESALDISAANRRSLTGRQSGRRDNKHKQHVPRALKQELAELRATLVRLESSMTASQTRTQAAQTPRMHHTPHNTHKRKAGG
ncbi:hypothetical protein HPB50_010438 [Hyalomma asiaticum]|uniref:Uncharacterized protein n=1 Tax=Hyalomma asiaticum TaxID=266040 RepID=A0ACB7T3R4_HYAAI|nr:hypothetical protein HPB50_010438 [Hyalomma asiaticum]